ncbi:MAG: lipid-A-disaccharide synthase [Deltaproteobacteria bacterium]|nr:MAG: lipid-A-disaccharide synthase [Deltaproteobacteria bacterium]
MQQGKRVLIVAGEASGDLHGANLIKAVKQKEPRVEFYGVGGRRMEGAGASLWFNLEELSVVGLTEIITKSGAIVKALSRLKKSLKEAAPELIVLIDFPGFNLMLARSAKKKTIPVLYYISPQVWAWRRKRVNKIAKVVNKMAVILPFEVPIYREKGVDVEFVGHPLLDVIEKETIPREEVLKQLELNPTKKLISLLPGSRRDELIRLLPEMLGAGELLEAKYSDLQFALLAAPTLEKEEIQKLVAKSKLRVNIFSDHHYDLLRASELAVITSGTAALEAALLNTPMVVIYKVSLITYLVARMLIKVKYLSLANLLAGKTVVPELIQSEANSKRIAEEAEKILSGRETTGRMKLALNQIRETLGEPGAAARVASIVLKML